MIKAAANILLFQKKIFKIFNVFIKWGYFSASRLNAVSHS